MTSAEISDYFHEATRSDTERDDILRAAMLWVNHDAANQLTDLENLLQQVQLDKCSVQTILDIMRTYGAMIGPHVNVLNLLTEAMTKGLSRTEQKSASKGQNVMLEDTTKPKASQENVQQTSAEYNMQTSECETMERPAAGCEKPRTQEIRMQTTKLARKKKPEKQSSEHKAQKKQNLVIIGGDVDSENEAEVSRVCWKLNRQNQFTKLCDIPYNGLKYHSACWCPQGFITTGGIGSDLCIIVPYNNKVLDKTREHVEEEILSWIYQCKWCSLCIRRPHNRGTE